MNVADLNIWAILAATVAVQAVGALWYSPLMFARLWLRATGKTEEEIKANPSRTPFIVSIVAHLVLACAVALLFQATGIRSVGGVVTVGLVLGIGVAAMAAAPHYAFTGQTRSLYLIDQGMNTVSLLVMSLIIGLWP